MVSATKKRRNQLFRRFFILLGSYFVLTPRYQLKMHRIVGSFLGNLDIMGMAFFQARIGNAHKLSFFGAISAAV